MCALRTGYKTCIIAQTLEKIDILAVDETKHMLLSIFHALYMCLIERLEEKKKLH